MYTALSDFVKKSEPIIGNAKTAKEELLYSVRCSENISYPTTMIEPTERVEFTVRFSHNVAIRKTLSLKDYTIEELEACWYSQEESKAIQKQCREEIRRIEMGKKLNDKKYCSRGLEGHTTAGASSRNRKRKVAISAVLDEQWLQWDEGIFDEYAIADIYQFSSLVGAKFGQIMSLFATKRRSGCLASGRGHAK